MKTQAIQKINSELAAYKGDRYGGAMKDYIAGVLKEFCDQNEEFAQAVVQGGKFEECMKTVAGKVKGQSISDLGACKAAAEFYFPGSVVEFHMTIRMSKYEAEEQNGSIGGGILNFKLEDLL